MSKITLSTVGSLSDPTTAQNTINANFSVIQAAMDNTVSRDGTQPNTLTNSLDANNFQIINLPAPVTVNSPVRLADVNAITGGGVINTVPSGGTTGQYLGKNSNANYDLSWQTNTTNLPTGGTTNQVLTKNSNANFDTSWQTPTAFQNYWSTGDAKLTFKTTADATWVMCDDGTIGDGSSGGTTRANADCSALFQLLWSLPALLTVSGGRGASAAADFAAHKTIQLPLVLGRALAIAGTGAGLTARTLATTAGEENHSLSTGEIPSHQHSVFLKDPTHTHFVFTGTIGGTASGGAGLAGINTGGGSVSAAAASTGLTIGSVNGTANDNQTATFGGNSAHNNIQPTSYINVMVKL